MVDVVVTAAAVVSFTVSIDDEDLLEQSINEYVKYLDLSDYTDEAEIESIDSVDYVEVE